MTVQLRYLPDYSASNPYQRMLYRACAQHGIDAQPITLRELAELATTESDRTVLHVHWTNPVVQPFDDPLAARTSMRSFIADIDRLRRRGARLLWTVHNVLPHDHRHHLLEVELHRALAERADIIHVLTPRTTTASRLYYPLDDARMMHVPHSSFIGEYPPAIPREQARRELGIAPDERVIAMLGRLRPYRGARRLLDALDLLAADGLEVRLLLGGRVSDDSEMVALRERADRAPHVIAEWQFLEHEKLALWLSAADAAAMPYESILNSGSFGLALTFGLPVVAPAMGTFLDEVGSSYATLYEPRSTAALAAAVATALDPATLVARQHEARVAAEQRSPERMADDFAATLATRLRALD